MYKKEKSDAEWEQINFKNSLGPQIGGLLHDAVALAVAFKGKFKYPSDKTTTEDEIKYWLNTLYEIAENKKRNIAMSQLESTEDQLKVKKQIEYEETSKLDDINLGYQQEKAEAEYQKNPEFRGKHVD